MLRVHREQLDQLEVPETQDHLVQEENKEPKVLMDRVDQLVLKAQQVAEVTQVKEETMAQQAMLEHQEAKEALV